MNCKEHFNKEIFSNLANKLASRGYVIDELDKVSRVLISKLSECFDKLAKDYNIKISLTSENINSHAIECNGEWVYFAWDNQQFDFYEAKKIIKEFCNKK